MYTLPTRRDPLLSTDSVFLLCRGAIVVAVASDRPPALYGTVPAYIQVLYLAPDVTGPVVETYLRQAVGHGGGEALDVLARADTTYIAAHATPLFASLVPCSLAEHMVRVSAGGTA